MERQKTVMPNAYKNIFPKIRKLNKCPERFLNFVFSTYANNSCIVLSVILYYRRKKLTTKRKKDKATRWHIYTILCVGIPKCETESTMYTHQATTTNTLLYQISSVLSNSSFSIFLLISKFIIFSRGLARCYHYWLI